MEKEIEVKARLINKDDFVKRLAGLSCVFSAPVFQHDRIFIPQGMTVPVPAGTNVLRIRVQDGKYMFTLKQPILNELDCIEKELEITNPEILAEIFELLGFRLSSEVKKTRQKCEYQGYEVCVDEVEGLGSFVELEKLSSEGHDALQEQAKMVELLERLGIPGEQRVYSGYDVLMYQKAHAL